MPSHPSQPLPYPTGCPRAGPAEKLDKTECSQPALFVAGLAAVELLKSQGPEGAAMVAGCGLTAGLSLGEYCALVFAGALSFEDGLKVRSEGSTTLWAPFPLKIRARKGSCWSTHVCT